MVSGWDIAGTIADSVASLGTVGALLWAVFLYRRQVEDARTEQASRVFVALRAVDLGGRTETHIVLDNASDRPVFRLYVVLQVSVPGRTTSRIKAVDVEHLAAGKHESVDDLFDKPYPLPYLKAIIKFEDAAGLCWVRDSTGRLSRHEKHFDPRTLEGDRGWRSRAMARFWRLLQRRKHATTTSRMMTRKAPRDL